MIDIESMVKALRLAWLAEFLMITKVHGKPICCIS